MSQHTVRPIRTILLATGLSQESIGAVEMAQQFAELYGATLHAAHVIEPSDSATEAALGLSDTHDQQAREELDRFVHDHGLSETATLHVLRGEPERELLTLRQEIDADLLVIGRYGKGGLKQGRLGSIADRVVRHCQVSSLVVQPEFRGAYAKLGVASGLVEDGHEELPRALEVARHLGLDEIVLMHAYEMPHGYHTVMTRDEATQRIEQSFRERAQELLKRECSDTDPKVRIEIRQGRPSRAIPELVAECGIELLVIGAAYQTSVAAAALLGRTTEHILRDVPCSVWAETTPEMREGFLEVIKHLFD